MVQMLPSRKDTGKTRSVHSWAVIGIFIILLGAAVACARQFLMPVTLTAHRNGRKARMLWNWSAVSR